LEHSPYENWEQKAFSETEVPIAINALMTLALWKERELSAKIVERLNQLDWQSGSRSQRETAAYTYWLCIPQGDMGGQTQEATITKIKQAFPDREFSVNRLLSELLVMLGATDVVDRLLELATTAPTQSQQMHFLFVLRSVKDGWSPRSRRAYFEMLSQMKDYVGGQGMNDFITKIRSDAVGMLSEEEQKSLHDLLQSAQERASPQETLPESLPKRSFVKRWTTEALLEALQQTGDSGDPKRGEALFAAVQCVHCHQVGSKGRSIGPNLTGVGRRFGARDLLDAIVVPSRVIPEPYQAVQVVTVDGKVYVGQASLAGDYRSPLLRLATDASRPYDITEIEKSNIESQQPSRTSWMPEGLLDTLTAAEVADLLAFLNAGG
jgi:putative heme-binding domain-containing protein